MSCSQIPQLAPGVFIQTFWCEIVTSSATRSELHAPLSYPLGYLWGGGVSWRDFLHHFMHFSASACYSLFKSIFFLYPFVTNVFLFVILDSYYVRNQLDATFAVLFINNCKSTLHVSDVHSVHHQEYINCSSSHWYMSWVGMMYIQ